MVWWILIWLIECVEGMIIISVLDSEISSENQLGGTADVFWGGSGGLYNRIMGHIILGRIWMFGF